VLERRDTLHFFVSVDEHHLVLKKRQQQQPLGHCQSLAVAPSGRQIAAGRAGQSPGIVSGGTCVCV
jgi:hypothetical protein